MKEARVREELIDCGRRLQVFVRSFCADVGTMDEKRVDVPCINQKVHFPSTAIGEMLTISRVGGHDPVPQPPPLD